MIVGVEATSLIGHRSGVGQVTASICEALVQVDEGIEEVLLPISLRRGGWVRRAIAPHPRIRVVRGRLPAKVANAVWSRVEWPPAELFCGQLDVFWGPNFVLPPLVKAAGVVTVHDLSFVHVPEMCSEHTRTYADLVPKMAARANRIIVDSHFIEQQFAEWLPDEAPRVRVVYPGVRRVFRERGGALTPPRREALGISDPYAVFLGNLEARKNVEVLLRAFEQLRVVRPEAQLVLIGGPGPGWDGISARCEKILNSGAIRVVGYLPDEEVAAIVRGAKVFVYPSRYEGFGLPPLEAMVAGTPVIASKAASMPEVLGDHARWVHPDDVEGIASAMSDFFEGADSAALDAAREHALSFTWGESAMRMIEVFVEAKGEVDAA